MNIVIKPLYKLEVRFIDEEKGFGVFANQNIKKNSIIEVCYSLKLKKSEIQHPNFDYLFYSKKTEEHYFPFGYGSIYNHSNEPNINWELTLPEMGIIEFFSIKDIKKGEELTHNYGTRYWKSREKKII